MYKFSVELIILQSYATEYITKYYLRQATFSQHSGLANLQNWLFFSFLDVILMLLEKSEIFPLFQNKTSADVAFLFLNKSRLSKTTFQMIDSQFFAQWKG